MNKLLHGDCLELMKNIPDKSVDFILTDPPYGTTACKWDSVIPFEPMWEQLKRVIKDNGAIALFGSEPFSSALRMSNIKMFKYDWVWVKNLISGMALAKKQPMRKVEIISIFYKQAPLYSPILRDRETPPPGNKNPTRNTIIAVSKTIHKRDKPDNKAYPHNVLEFKADHSTKRLHTSQKPVALLEYLIKTYTLEGETVLDFTMGSGSTGVACKNLTRNFIGIEQDLYYYKIACARIAGDEERLKILKENKDKFK